MNFLSMYFIQVPLHPVEHHYLHTKPIDGLDSMTPVTRDLDGYIYFRENNGSLLAGGFEPVAKPAFEDGIIPGSYIGTFVHHLFHLYKFIVKKKTLIGMCRRKIFARGLGPFSCFTGTNAS